MKKFAEKIVKLSAKLAPFALVLATVTANSTCFWFSHQPDVPKKLMNQNEDD